MTSLAERRKAGKDVSKPFTVRTVFRERSSRSTRPNLEHVALRADFFSPFSSSFYSLPYTLIYKIVSLHDETIETRMRIVRFFHRFID